MDLKQINTSNVNKLDVAWSHPTGDDTTYTFSPLVIDNIAYFAAKTGSLVAVDASTGKELWAVTPHPRRCPFAGFAGITGQRGGNYWESKDRKDRRILVSSGEASCRLSTPRPASSSTPSPIMESFDEDWS